MPFKPRALTSERRMAGIGIGGEIDCHSRTDYLTHSERTFTR